MSKKYDTSTAWANSHRVIDPAQVSVKNAKSMIKVKIIEL